VNNKKILFVADAKSIHTAKWVDYFVEQDYEVYLATFANENVTKSDNVYFLSRFSSSNSGGNYHYLLGVNKLAKLVREIKPDIINAHFSYSYGLVAYLAAKLSNSLLKLSVVCHGSDILVPPLPYITNKINCFILNRVDKVFVVSDQIKDRVESFGVNPAHIFVGQYGVKYDVPADNKDIDIISNRAYVPNSRIDFLLINLSKLDLTNKKVIFVLPHISDEKFENIKLDYPSIVFYKALDYKKMQDFVSRSKLYISATESDGTSLSLLEAMNLGCIPLISNIVSNRSWVLDGINGYLFNNEMEFQSKLEKLLGQNDDLHKFRSLNWQLIKSKGLYDVQMQKIEQFLVSHIKP
jgi:glycosyltransferase involved in cell wall biosynthesis